MKKYISFFFALILCIGIADSAKYIEVDKKINVLRLIDGDSTIMKIHCCVGRGYGQKTRKGDHKTPEGTYKIHMIQPSDSWPHDFHDGRGPVRGTYGPWFFRLNTPQSTHIGLHGTSAPETIGTRDSDGCVRMHNDDLLKLKPHVFNGMEVVILPDVVSDPTPIASIMKLLVPRS